MNKNEEIDEKSGTKVSLIPDDKDEDKEENSPEEKNIEKFRKKIKKINNKSKNKIIKKKKSQN